MKRTMLVLAAAALATMSSWVVADGAKSPYTFSANVAYATDYMYRGQSQTSNKPAVSGGFDMNYSSDLPFDVYAGTWASNISFGGNIETDWYGGLTGKVADTGITWNTGFLYYLYPGSRGQDLNFVEAHVGAGYEFSNLPGSPTLGFKVHWSPDWQLSSGTSVYYEGNLSFSLPYDIGLSGHIGRQTIKNNLKWGTPDWTEWNVSVSKGIGPFSFAVGYYDTNLNQKECFGTNICTGRAVASVSASF